MNAIAGISGGRTSAFMAFGLPLSTVLCFQNTGREHPKTIEFLRRLEQDLGRQILCVEYRSPPRGDEPKFSTFELVPWERAAMKGEPFTDMLLCLASYRAKHKGKGPTGPWANSRICTAHLKLKTKMRLCASWGWRHGEYTDYVGLRADEPRRVAKMHARNDERDGDERAPLAEQGITKQDVLRFWDSKPYRLDLPEYLGNCTGCFLKDEGHLARALSTPETDAAWWVATDEAGPPMRRGRSSYRQVLEEAPARRRIRTALECGEEPAVELSPRRHGLILKQERRDMEGEVESFSCSCEGAEALAMVDE